MTIPEILKQIDEQQAIRDEADNRLGELFKLLADTADGQPSDGGA